MPCGSLQGHCVDKASFEAAIPLYYEMMGWNSEGVPTRGKFAELGMEELWEI